MRLSKYTTAAILICESMVEEIREEFGRCNRCKRDQWGTLPIVEQIQTQLEILSEAKATKAALAAANCIRTLAKIICDNEADTPSCVIEAVMGKVCDELED